MPTIVAKKDGTCRTCGGRVRKSEYADFQADKGLAHPELACAQGTPRHRPNTRAGTCSCGTHVAPGKGRLRLLEDRGPGQGKRWAVDCARCAGL